jgi:hypothetical protein
MIAVHNYRYIFLLENFKAQRQIKTVTDGSGHNA